MASKCKEVPSLLGSIEFCAGESVRPGIRPHAYVISQRDIVKWPSRPKLSDAGATMSKLASYSGDFVLAADKKWMKIDAIPNKGSFSCEKQGEFPSVTYLNKISLTHPGIGDEATGFCQLCVIDHFVMLVPQRDGRYRVFGNPDYDLELKPKLESGEGTNGGGTSIEGEVTDISPAPFYPGKIETADGAISGADGTMMSAAAGSVSLPS